MIVTVTLNPAIDTTYEMDRLVPGDVHRVRAVEERPGGKGVNVARVLAALGEPVVAVGPGDAGFEASLAAYGVPAIFPSLLPSVRRTVAVVTPDGTTSMQEPGRPVAAGAADELERVVAEQLDRASALVVSGSVAPGLPVDLPVRLAALAAAKGVPAVLDLDDGPLGAAAAAGGAVLMPNRDELGRLLGADALDDVPAAARALSARTSAPVVVTLGAEGLTAAVGAECWRAAPPSAVAGNPTGAGDATAAGVVRGLAHQVPWPRLLADAVALGAAAVAAPVAGEIDQASYRRWVDAVDVRRLAPTTQES